MLERSLGLPRKSSTIFAHLRTSSEVSETFGNVRMIFGQVFENFRKSLNSGRKSSENLQNRRHQDVYIIKRTLYVSSKI